MLPVTFLSIILVLLHLNFLKLCYAHPEKRQVLLFFYFTKFFIGFYVFWLFRVVFIFCIIDFFNQAKHMLTIPLQ